jgi:hypothetical protein
MCKVISKQVNSKYTYKHLADSFHTGADYMKVGFVSRLHPKESQSHMVLGQQLYKPEEFARQVFASLPHGTQA